MSARLPRALTGLPRILLLASLTLLTACEAQLGTGPGLGATGTPTPGGDGDSTTSPDDPDQPVMGDTDGDGVPDSPVECASSIGQDLVLLSELAFVNSVADLVGDEVLEGRLVPEAETKNFSQKGIVANTSLVSTRLDWAEHASTMVDGQAAALTGCAVQDEACARSYLSGVMHRAFRRPISDVEIDDLMSVFAVGAETSFEDGLKTAIQALVLAPSFNHRTEYGTPNGDGTFNLTAHELASSLSYLLTDSAPDEELLTAADDGTLTDPATLVAHTDRMLADTDVQDSVEKTLLAAWTLGNLFGKVKDPGLYPEFGSALASQMYHETELFLKDNLWDPGKGLNALLTSRTTRVNEALANIYGVPFPGAGPNEFVEVELPADHRAGLLTQLSFLTTLSRTDSTSVVARGLFVNGPLLCFPKIPSPPEAALAAVEEQLEEDLTERERAASRAATSPCNNCHAQFDAFGLLLENYDAVGQFSGVDENGIPVDSAVDVQNKGALDGYYPDYVSFAERAAQGPELAQCVTRHLLAYATGENGLTREGCEVFNTTLGYDESTTLRDVILAVVQSDTFSVRTAESAP